MGWFTVVAYLAAAALCAAAAPSTPNDARMPDQERRWWLALSTILLLLGINKQLDLQSLLTEVARAAAKTEGWYGERRQVQFAFVEIIAITGIGVMSSLFWSMRRGTPSLKLGLLGLTATSVFVVVRAASFHHVDLWLGQSILGARWNWIIELSGIATIAAGAVWSKMQPGGRNK